jgi:prepilin-type N-terminal cleavage/methylation domain-containing protein
MRARTRTGFTLIELMVAMALTLFIMVILSQAFVTSLETFSGMKALGDMQQDLRSAMVMLRDDLSQDHFEGKRRLSDQTTTNNSSELASRHPQAGFFAVRRGSTAPLVTPPSTPPYPLYASEGTDASPALIPSLRAVDHLIYMTVKRKGNRQENFFNTALQGNPVDLGKFFGQKTAYDVLTNQLPYATQSQEYAGGTTGYYSSQWAEVLYFLVRTGSTEQPKDPTSTMGTPTYGLYRAQFVMVSDPTYVNKQFLTLATPADATALSVGTFSGISCRANGKALTFYSPADAARSGTNRVFNDFGTTVLRGIATAAAGGASEAAGGVVTIKTTAAHGFSAGQTVTISGVTVKGYNGAFTIMSTPTTTTFTYINPMTGLGAAGSGTATLKYDPEDNPRILNPQTATLNPQTATLVCPNVISFQVQLMYLNQTTFVDVAGTTYDTTSIPSGLKGIQVTLRVWDNKTRQTRQSTIVQDL